MMRWCWCIIFLLSSAIQAQDNQLVSPDPLTLEANWWAYFEPVEKIDKVELVVRIEKIDVRIEQLMKSVSTEQRITLAPLAKKIRNDLRLFSDLQETAISDVPSVSPALAQYTIDQALERFVLWRKLKREFNLEQDDLAWQKAQLSLERKRQSQRRNDYLQLATSDPQRVSQGVELIASRVSLELAVVQKKLRDSKLKASKLQAQRVEDELAIIHQRLAPSSSNDESWLKEQSKAKAKVDAIRQQARVPVPVNDQSPDTPLGAANIKHLLLAAAGTEVQISIHELSAMRYRLMQALEQSVGLQTQNQQSTESLSDVSKQVLDLKQSFNEQYQSWRSLTEQSKNFAAAQAANFDKVDLVLGQAYKRLLKQADNNDRWLRDFELELDLGNFLVQLAQAKIEDDVSWLKRWMINAQLGVVNSWGQVSTWLNATLFEISEAPVTTMGLLRVLFIISIALLFSKIFRRGLGRLGQRKEGVSSSSLYTLGRVVHYIILIVGIIVGLSSIGIDFTKFALFASALGVGIGFGLQTLISNFVAGLIILFERSLKVGDFVELSSGLVGEVKEINMRSTLINTNDNVDILVPNSEFMNGQVTNWTLTDVHRRIHVPFGVAYGTDKELVKKAALEAADEVKWTSRNSRHRHPEVWLVKFGDSSLNFELVVWLIPEAVKRPGTVQATYLWEIDSKLKKYDIEIPFPQRDLHLRSVFGQKDEAGLLFINKRNEQ